MPTISPRLTSKLALSETTRPGTVAPILRDAAIPVCEAVLAHAFDVLQLHEVLAFTVPANLPSQGLMQRLGMQHQVEQDFQHPLLPPGHPLRRHVLYRLTQASWRQRIASRAIGVD